MGSKVLGGLGAASETPGRRLPRPRRSADAAELEAPAVRAAAAVATPAGRWGAARSRLGPRAAPRHPRRSPRTGQGKVPAAPAPSAPPPPLAPPVPTRVPERRGPPHLVVRPSPFPARRRPPPPLASLPKPQPALAPARALSQARVTSPRASGTRRWMQFRSPPAAGSSLAPPAASSSGAAAPAPGQPGPSCPALGASRGGRPGTPPAGRVEEEEEEEEEDVEQVPCPARNTWLRGRHRSLRGRRGAPGRAMGGCEVPEFLLQLGFFLPLLTVWPGDCSHVSSNQGKGRGGEAGGAGGGGCSEDRCMGRLPQVTSSRRSFSRLAPGAVQEVPSLELPVHLARDGDLPDFGPYLLPSVFKGMREPRQQLSAAAGPLPRRPVCLAHA